MFLKNESSKQKKVHKRKKKILLIFKQKYEQNKETKQKFPSLPPSMLS